MSCLPISAIQSRLSRFGRFGRFGRSGHVYSGSGPVAVAVPGADSDAESLGPTTETKRPMQGSRRAATEKKRPKSSLVAC